MDLDNSNDQRARLYLRARISLFIFVMCFLLAGYGLGILFPPKPDRSHPLKIERGMNAEQIADALKRAHVIRSRTLFVWIAYEGGFENRLGAGTFTFSEPVSTFTALQELLRPQKEVTLVIPEGFTLKQIGAEFEKIGLGSKEDFLTHSRGKEGFLFPDTYRFFDFTTADEVIQKMLENFDKKIKPLDTDIRSSGRELDDIVRMASIIEKEVSMSEDRALVSGILWKRFDSGMFLQADATLFYEIGKESRELTLEDLRAPTPYNTYIHKGLPPGPIGNPGLDAIRAALFPKKSPYLYYLSGKDGVTHYARTLEEHKKNKARL